MKFIYCIGLLINCTLLYAANQLSITTNVCAACHGTTGHSIQPEWPHLAGQHTQYLRQQLLAYKQGERVDPIMTPIVTALTTDMINKIAKFYALQTDTKHKHHEHNNARGESIYFHGDIKQHITACVACHGPTGKGNALANFPVLSGQQQMYLIKQLHAFKQKTRHNDFNHIMQDISQHMSDADIQAIAEYIANM